MAARRNLLRAEFFLHQIFARKIFVGIVRHFAVRRQEAGLRAQHQFLALESLGEKLFSAAPIERSLRWKRYLIAVSMTFAPPSTAATTAAV